MEHIAVQYHCRTPWLCRHLRHRLRWSHGRTLLFFTLHSFRMERMQAIDKTTPMASPPVIINLCTIYKPVVADRQKDDNVMRTANENDGIVITLNGGIMSSAVDKEESNVMDPPTNVPSH